MGGRNSATSLVFVGVVALIAGLGRLVQHFAEGADAPDSPPVIVFVISIAFGLAIVMVAVVGAVRIYIRAHPDFRVRRALLALGVLLAAFVLSFVSGLAGVGQ